MKWVSYFSKKHCVFFIIVTFIFGGCAINNATNRGSIVMTGEATVAYSTNTLIMDPQIFKPKTVTPPVPNPTPDEKTGVTPSFTANPNQKAVGVVHKDGSPDELGNTDFLINRDGEVIGQFNGPGNYLLVRSDPCSLYSVNHLEDGFAVIKVDFQGNQLEYKKIELLPEYRHTWDIFEETLSPDGTWISYYWTSGEGGEYDPRDAKNRNLELINVQQNTGKPFLVTVAGGSTKQGGSWSSDSRLFTYTDRDRHGDQQIYLMNVQTMEKRQVSQFDPGQINEIYAIKFSPDGKKVGFVGSMLHGTDPENGNVQRKEGVAGVIDLETMKPIFFMLPDQSFDTSDIFWWNRSSDGFVTKLQAYRSGDYLAWFDLITGQMVRLYPDTNSKTAVISAIFPLADIEKILIQGYDYFVYDLKKSTVNKIQFPDLCCSPIDYLVFDEERDLNACMSK